MRRVEENRHASSLQLSKEVESQTGVIISRDTIRRTLQRNGMHGCRPRKKPLLKPRHKWRFSTAWYGTVRHGSVRYGTAHFGSVAFPPQFSTAIEWAGLFTRRYNCAASTAVTSS